VASTVSARLVAVARSVAGCVRCRGGRCCRRPWRRYLLIGGWTLGAALQPAGYSTVRDTISALAGLAATHREVMTIGLAGLGVCHVVTAAGLRPAVSAGRVLLAVGGVATVLVAAFPVPGVGTSNVHRVMAGIGFVGAVALSHRPRRRRFFIGRAKPGAEVTVSRAGSQANTANLSRSAARP
jgi:hypothetical protein